MSRFIYLGLIIVVVGVHADVVEISDGKVEGTTRVARNGRIFKAYQGIPYAKAPVGELRFQPPVPVEKWDGVFNATGTPPMCPQIPNGSSTYGGTEDCLYVNVYTPQNAKPGTNLPVIIYIFGGAFRYGYPLKFGPEYTLSRDIILVMVSYRIGVLGFLSTGDSFISGNMGLKDQTLAMKWTEKNIYAFGGDPSKVTLQGHSSGAICVHLHTFSPLSQGYFNRVIIQSGFATTPNFFTDKDTARGIFISLTRGTNCTGKNSKKFVECLLSKDAEILVRATAELQIWPARAGMIFKPVIEGKDVENAFLNEVPILATYPSNEIAWLIGMTTGEGATWVADDFANSRSLQDIATISPTLTLPIVTWFLWSTKPTHLDYISRAVKAHFFGDERICPHTDNAYVDMVTGAYFGMGMLETVQKYKGMKYVYLYDYRANHTNQNANYRKFLGVAHGDEIQLLFKKENTQGLTDDDLAFGDEMITRWINFAYTGNPNEPFPINTSIFGAWSPMTSPHIEFLRIKKNGSMEANYFREKYEFWFKLPVFSKYK